MITFLPTEKYLFFDKQQDNGYLPTVSTCYLPEGIGQTHVSACVNVHKNNTWFRIASGQRNTQQKISVVFANKLQGLKICNPSSW